MEQKTDTSLPVDLQHTDVTDKHRDERLRITGNKYFILFPGKTSKTRENIIRNVLQKIPDLKEVPTVAECDFILVLCIIVSRAGTDIDAAVNELNALSESKKAIFIVLHHTFDPEKTVPDSSRHVTRTDTLTVDCLFYEDQLLACDRNQEALNRIEQSFSSKVKGAQKEMSKADFKFFLKNQTKAEDSTTMRKSGKDLPKTKNQKKNFCSYL